jgi:hypothetical protein
MGRPAGARQPRETAQRAPLLLARDPDLAIFQVVRRDRR